MILKTLPGLTLLFAALIAVLPFGASEGVRACLSFAPLVVTHYWSARRPRLVPATLVFLAGLSIDVLTHGPIGFWSLMMLAAAAFARLEVGFTGHSTAAGRAAVFSIAMFAVAGLAWAVASGYNGVLIEGRLMVLAALVSIGLYPLVSAILMPIDRLWDTQRGSHFARGA